MTVKTLAILLALSLLFNVFVLLGFAQSRQAQPELATDETVIKQVANELQLNDEQARIFRELRSNTRKQAAELNEALMLVRQRLKTELRQDSPDLELVQTLVDREAELIRQRRHLGAESFGQFFGKLNPQQRHALAQRFDRPRRGSERDAGKFNSGGAVPQFILKRHDKNGNGVLDPDELDAAIQRGPQWHRMGESRRPPHQFHAAPPLNQPWRRFDVDHNNVLDADELAKMDEFRRERARENEANQPPQ